MDNTDIINEFLLESHENLDKLDQEFVKLEKNPLDKELLSSIFRVIHTIKGACGFLDFHHLEKVTHVGENLLSKLRDGELIFNASITTALLVMIDAIREMLRHIESNGSDGDNDYQNLIAVLTELSTGTVQQTHLAAVSNLSTHTITDGSIRVNVDLLDKLMNLVGELVLSRNQIMQYIESGVQSDLALSSQRLNLITSELQENVMKTRMQPILNVWNKFPRIVRDLSHSLGKKVKITMEGEATEIDKTIIENIKDPLTHLIRNTLDHGIEKPNIRAQKGKREEGLLHLKAYQEGGQVIIELTDDGNGINLEKIKEKALSNHLFDNEKIEQMNAHELTHLILMPGFSTAEKVTSISGRGVGMDVVKTQIEHIGGVIELQNNPGLGLTVKMKIPLTLAIIPALLITQNKKQYAIPQVSLVELIRLEHDDVNKKIDWLHGSPIYRLRDRLLPLVFLDNVLKKSLANKDSTSQQSLYIIILQAEDQQYGLVVNEVNDTQEIVVKPLGNLIKNISEYAGATILGDGQVALILDAIGIAREAGILGGTAAILNDQQPTMLEDKLEDKQSLLLVRSGHNNLAVPLHSVLRLEIFPAQAIEYSGSIESVQYRNRIMPLIRINSLLEAKHDNTELEQHKDLKVVVHANGNKHYGIVVDEIMDTVEQVINEESHLAGDIIKASAIIDGDVTQIVDVDGLLSIAMQ